MRRKRGIMESGRPINPLNQQLNQYLDHMQSEVGRSGRSLHQIFTEYVSLKTKYPELAQALEILEIEDVESITPEQAKDHQGHLLQLQNLQIKVLQSFINIKEHPWRDFAHPDLQHEEHELLLRSLRFVSIQLSKFWVEVQSFPLFLNVLNEASVQEVEDLFHWLQSGPSWESLVQQPRLIPVLNNPTSRKVLLEFARDVKCVQALQRKIAEKQGFELSSSKDLKQGMSLLSEGISLAKKHKLEEYILEDLTRLISEIQEKMNQIGQVQAFFDQLTQKTAFPKAKGITQSQHVYEAVNYIRKIPDAILLWRQPRIIASGQMVRIKAWQDRAKPILESRKRLEPYFKLGEKVTTDYLRDLAAMLTSGGVFRSFKSPYREAVEMYRALLTPEMNEKRKLPETSLQMAERLSEWATYIEQMQTFENNAEAKTLFGTLFKGVDTDFNRACDANAWASQIRAELGTGEAYGDAVIDFIFKATPAQLQSVVEYFENPNSETILKLLADSKITDQKEFSDLAGEEEKRLKDLKKLDQVAQQLGIKKNVEFKELNDLFMMAEEIQFLTGRMDQNPDLRSWLKGEYKTAETDLALIEQALYYIQFIENSEIPDALKTSFLSVYGPQRFGENRALVASALTSLNGLKDHLQKLDAVSHGKVQVLIQGPIPELLNRIQQACKYPNLLDSWIDYLRCERDARAAGLGKILDFYEQKTIVSEFYGIAYNLVLNASLLKKAITQPIQLLEEVPIRPMVH